MTEAFDIAMRWRVENGFSDRGGYVVFGKEGAVGWILDLESPQSWEPGCTAVSETGHVFAACGGDAQRGAMSWHPVEVYSPCGDGQSGMSPRHVCADERVSAMLRRFIQFALAEAVALAVGGRFVAGDRTDDRDSEDVGEAEAAAMERLIELGIEPLAVLRREIARAELAHREAHEMGLDPVELLEARQ